MLLPVLIILFGAVVSAVTAFEISSVKQETADAQALLRDLRQNDHAA